MKKHQNKIPVANKRLALIKQVLIFCFSGLFILFLIFTAIAYSNGSRWFVVESPSMGTAAPVGSLIVSHPVTADELRVDDIITFRSPSQIPTPYTHRITDISAEGITTKGDINGATDPWKITSENIIGKSQVFPALGYILKGMPFLVVGLILVWLFTAYWVRIEHRLTWRILLNTLVVCAIIVWLKPFVGFVVLNTTQQPDSKKLIINVVSTGALPEKLSVNKDGDSRVIRSGEIADLKADTANQNGLYIVNSSLELSLWGWIIAGLVCLTPVFVVLLLGVPVHPKPPTFKKEPSQ